MSETTTVTVTPAGETPAPAETPAKVETTKTPEELQKELESAQARIHELNKENEGRRLKQQEFEAAQAKAEEERLAKQGEFETLAKTRESERDTVIGERDVLRQQVEQYEEIVGRDLNARIEKWPDKLKALVPTEGSALQRLQRIAELEPIAQEFASTPAPGGVRPGPVATGAPAVDEKAAKEASRRTFAF